MFEISDIKTHPQVARVGFIRNQERKLPLKYYEFIADEVPNERKAGCGDLGHIDPNGRRKAEKRIDKGGYRIDNPRIDAEADNADRQELPYFDGANGVLILKRPIFIPEITIGGRYCERDTVKQDEDKSPSHSGNRYENI